MLSSTSGSISNVESGDFLTIFMSGQVVETLIGVTHSVLLSMKNDGTNVNLFEYSSYSSIPQQFSHLYHDSSNRRVNFCLEIPEYEETLFAQFSTSSSQILNQFLLQIPGTTYECLAAYGSGSTSYFYITDGVSSFQFLKVSFSASSYTLYPMSYISNPTFKMKKGLIFSSLSSFYVGSTQQLSDSQYTQTFSSPAGILHSFDPTLSCLSFSNSGQSSIPYIQQSFLLSNANSVFSIGTFPVSILTSPSLVSMIPFLNPNSTATSWCNYLKYIQSPNGISSKTYMITRSPLDFTAPSFQFTKNCSDLVEKYTSTYNGSLLPNFMTFNETSLDYDIRSNSTSDFGTYPIVFNYTVTDGAFKVLVFPVSIVGPCDTQWLTPVVDYQYKYIKKYNLQQDMIQMTLPTFPISAGPCSDVTYEVLAYDYNPLTYAMTLSPMESRLFTFNNQTMVFTIYSNLADINDTYVLVLRGTIDLSVHSWTMKFIVYVYPPCDGSLPVTNQQENTFIYYDISSGQVNCTGIYCNSSWRSTVKNCILTFAWAPFEGVIPLDPKFGFNIYGGTFYASTVADLGLYYANFKSFCGPLGLDSNITIKVVDCANLNQITTQPIPDQYYGIAETRYTFTVPGWSNTQAAECGPITYFYWCDDPRFYGLLYSFQNGTNPSFTVYQLDATYSGNYNITLYGKVALLNLTETVSFNLNVGNPCLYGVQVAPSVPDQTYYLRDPTLTIPVSIFTSNVSTLICGFYNYTLGSYDSSIFSFSYDAVGNPSLFLTSSDPAKAGNYTLTLSGWQGSQPFVVSTTFKVEIIDLCLTATISGFPNATINYTIPNKMIQIQYAAFVLSNPNCGVNYFFTNLDGSAVDASFFTMNNFRFSVYNSAAWKNGTYTLNYTGTLPAPYNYATYSSFITVYTNVSCSLTNITYTGNATNMDFTIGDAATVMNFDSWTDSMGICGYFNYVSTLSSGASLPSFIVFDNQTRTFTVESQTLFTYGNYSVVIKGRVGIYTQKQVTINIEVRNPCNNASLYASAANQVYTYYTQQSPINFTIGVFPTPANYTICNFQYVFTQDGVAWNTSIFSFDQLTMTLQVFTMNANPWTKDVAKLTNFQVLGYWGGDPTANCIITFQVNIIDSCIGSKILTYPTLDMTYTIFTDTHITQTVTPFLSDRSLQCGPFTYSLSLFASNMSDTSFLTLSSLILNITSTNANQIGIYYFGVVGQLPYYSLSNVTTFMVNMTCQIYYVDEIVIDLQYYIITFPTFQLNLPALVQHPACQWNYNTKIVMNDGSEIPYFIHYNHANSTMTAFTGNFSDRGLYPLSVVQTFWDWSQFEYAYPIEFRAKMIPFFSRPLQNQTVMVNTQINYSFPLAFDMNGCPFYIEVYNLPTFAQFGFGSVSAFPIFANQTGTYHMQVFLGEDCVFPLNQTRPFSLTVIEYSEAANITNENINISLAIKSNPGNFSSNSSNTSTGETFELEILAKLQNKTEITETVTDKVPPGISKLTAYIKSVSLKGLMIIQFNQELAPINVKEVTNKVLAIRFTPQQTAKQATLEGWNATDFQKAKLTIQLNFSDPIYVSSIPVRIFQSIFQDKDQLQIVFLNSSYFRAKAMNITVSQDYKLYFDAPPQIENNSTQTPVAFFSISSIYLSSFILPSFQPNHTPWKASPQSAKKSCKYSLLPT